MKKEIKQLRVKIDGLAFLTKELKPIGAIDEDNPIHRIRDPRTNSKEIEKAVDSLYLAKAWLGKILGLLNEDTPYKNDGSRKTIEDIEPAADQKYTKDDDLTDEFWKGLNHIEKVDWLRERIKSIINDSPDFSNDFTTTTIESIVLEQGFVYMYLSNARFWLGFELERIKNND